MGSRRENLLGSNLIHQPVDRGPCACSMLASDLEDGIRQFKTSLAKISSLWGLETGATKLEQHVENQGKAGMRGDMPLEGLTGFARGNSAPILHSCGGIYKYS